MRTSKDGIRTDSSPQGASQAAEKLFLKRRIHPCNRLHCLPKKNSPDSLYSEFCLTAGTRNRTHNTSKAYLYYLETVIIPNSLAATELSTIPYFLGFPFARGPSRRRVCTEMSALPHPMRGSWLFLSTRFHGVTRPITSLSEGCPRESVSSSVVSRAKTQNFPPLLCTWVIHRHLKLLPGPGYLGGWNH